MSIAPWKYIFRVETEVWWKILSTSNFHRYSVSTRNIYFQGAIDILSSRNLSEVSLFGAHLDFKSAVFRKSLESIPPFPPLEFKSAVFHPCVEL